MVADSLFVPDERCRRAFACRRSYAGVLVAVFAGDRKGGLLYPALYFVPVTLAKVVGTLVRPAASQLAPGWSCP